MAFIPSHSMWVDHFPQGNCKKLVGENLFNQLGFWSAEFKPRDKPEFRVKHCSNITGRLLQAQNWGTVCIYLPSWCRRLSVLESDYHCQQFSDTTFFDDCHPQYFWAISTSEQKDILCKANLNASTWEHKKHPQIQKRLISIKLIQIYRHTINTIVHC